MESPEDMKQVKYKSCTRHSASNILSSARELVYELSEYLSRRYPDTYSVTRHDPEVGDFGWYGEGQVKEVTILPLSVTYSLDEEDPMKVSSLL